MFCFSLEKEPNLVGFLGLVCRDVSRGEARRFAVRENRVWLATLQFSGFLLLMFFQFMVLDGHDLGFEIRVS
ncbi:hypothetical protein VIGAN_09086000 [Vigna angularis var. angularis]|uniref:Uncharacterized protein n=1 Tax=Vigna angularis var. angularis TaxID=157739 RepID=A0A0S3SX72_PHAAN|nr:hypothetical protein VIGAN_09086000 [Vigna angularis var. angularis]